MDNLTLNEEFNAIFPNHKIEIKSIENVAYFCVPVSESQDSVMSVPNFNPNADYAAECGQLRNLNEMITVDIENINREIRMLKDKIIELENLPPPTRVKKYQVIKKRDRRTAKEITKVFTCEFCNKGYGSEGSLNHHVKLKHPEQFRQLFLERSLDEEEEVYK